MVSKKKGEYDANIKKASDGRGRPERNLEEHVNKQPIRDEQAKKKN
jgi:hypothetical protein